MARDEVYIYERTCTLFFGIHQNKPDLARSRVVNRRKIEFSEPTFSIVNVCILSVWVPSSLELGVGSFLIESVHLNDHLHRNQRPVVQKGLFLS